MSKLGVVASVDENLKQSGDVNKMIFHNGKLYTGAEGGNLIVYNPDLTVNMSVQHAQFNNVTDMCIFKGDLVTTGNDGLLKVWDPQTLVLKKTLTGHENEVRVLRTDGDKLFSGDMSGKVKIWSSDYTLMFTLSVVEEVWSLAISGNIAFTARASDVTVTEVEYKPMDVPGETKFIVLDSFPGRGPLLLIQDKIVYCDREAMHIHLRENKSGHKELAKLEGHNKIITCMTQKDNAFYSTGWDGKVNMWDPAAMKLIASGTTVNIPAFSLAVGDDGAVYVGLADGNIVKMEKH